MKTLFLVMGILIFLVISFFGVRLLTRVIDNVYKSVREEKNEDRKAFAKLEAEDRLVKSTTSLHDGGGDTAAKGGNPGKPSGTE